MKRLQIETLGVLTTGLKLPTRIVYPSPAPAPIPPKIIYTIPVLVPGTTSTTPIFTLPTRLPPPPAEPVIATPIFTLPPLQTPLPVTPTQNAPVPPAEVPPRAPGPTAPPSGQQTSPESSGTTEMTPMELAVQGSPITELPHPTSGGGGGGGGGAASPEAPEAVTQSVRFKPASSAATIAPKKSNTPTIVAGAVVLGLGWWWFARRGR